MKKTLGAIALTAGLLSNPTAAKNSQTLYQTPQQNIAGVSKSVCDQAKNILECSTNNYENIDYNELMLRVEQQIIEAQSLIKKSKLSKSFTVEVSNFKLGDNKSYITDEFNNGYLLEEKDFETLTGLQQLSRENFAQVVGILLEKSGDRYIKMFDVTDSSARINKSKKAQKVLGAELDTAISLFNEGKEKLVVDSKETYARLLNASFGIAFIEGRGQVRNKWENNINLLDSFSNYLILTGQTNTWNKISYGDLKHNVAEFSANTNLSERYAQKFEKITNNFLVAMNKETQEEQEQYAQVNRIDELEKQGQELDSSIAQLKEQGQELDKKMSDRIEFLVITIISGIQAYETTGSDTMLTDVYKGINMLAEMKPMVQKVEKYQQMHAKALEDIQPYLSKLPEDKIKVLNN